MCVVAFAVAAPSTTYDHKPAYPAHQTYKHKEYDYVSFNLWDDSKSIEDIHDSFPW